MEDRTIYVVKQKDGAYFIKGSVKSKGFATGVLPFEDKMVDGRWIDKAIREMKETINKETKTENTYRVIYR